MLKFNYKLRKIKIYNLFEILSLLHSYKKNESRLLPCQMCDNKHINRRNTLASKQLQRITIKSKSFQSKVVQSNV